MVSSFSRVKLARYISDRISSGVSKSIISAQVAAFLIESGKTAEVNSLLRDVIEDSAVRHGYLEVIAVSARELSKETRSEIERLSKKQYPNAKKIIINSEIDPEAVGGVRLLFPQDQLDLSMKTKLNKLAAAR